MLIERPCSKIYSLIGLCQNVRIKYDPGAPEGYKKDGPLVVGSFLLGEGWAKLNQANSISMIFSNKKRHKSQLDLFSGSVPISD